MVRRLDLLTQRLSREQLSKPDFWSENILELDTLNGTKSKLKRQPSTRAPHNSTAAASTAVPSKTAAYFSSARVQRAQRASADNITSHMAQSVQYLSSEQLLTLSLNTALLNVSLDLKKEIPHPLELLPYFNTQTADVVYQELKTLIHNYKTYKPYPLDVNSQTNILEYTQNLTIKFQEDTVNAILYYKELQTLVHLLIACYKHEHLQINDAEEVKETNQIVDNIATLLKRVRPQISKDMDNFFYHENNAADFEQRLRQDKSWPESSLHPAKNESQALPKAIQLNDFLYPDVRISITKKQDLKAAGLLAEQCRNTLNQCRSSGMVIIKQIYIFLDTYPAWKEIIVQRSEQACARNKSASHRQPPCYISDSDSDSDPDMELFIEKFSIQDD